MENFKNYFKFPLKMWEDFDIKVFTNDNKMAFDWLINIPREAKNKIVAKINGETLIMSVKKEFWHENGIVFCKILEGINSLPISCIYAQIAQYSVKPFEQCKYSQILHTTAATFSQCFLVKTSRLSKAFN